MKTKSEIATERVKVHASEALIKANRVISRCEKEIGRADLALLSFCNSTAQNEQTIKNLDRATNHIEN